MRLKRVGGGTECGRGISRPLFLCNASLLFYLFNRVRISSSLTEKASAKVLRGSGSL